MGGKENYLSLPHVRLVTEAHRQQGLENKGVRIVQPESARRLLLPQFAVSVQRVKLLVKLKARRALCVLQGSLHPKHRWLNVKNVQLASSTNFQSTPSVWHASLAWHAQQQVPLLSLALQVTSARQTKVFLAKNVLKGGLNLLIE